MHLFIHLHIWLKTSLDTGEEVIIFTCLYNATRMAQHNAQYVKLLACRDYSTVYYAQNNSCACEIMLANEILTLLYLYLRLCNWSVGSGDEIKDEGNQCTQCPA